MPKLESRKQEEADLAAYTARWLQLADAALSATEKAAKALEIAREEQEHIRRDIRRKLANYKQDEAAQSEEGWLKPATARV
jgi:hypothetical protein